MNMAMSRIPTPLAYGNGKRAASWLQDNCHSSEHYIRPQRYKEGEASTNL